MRKIRVRVSGGVPYTPLVQWIERETSKLMMRVQFLQGVPYAHLLKLVEENGLENREVGETRRRGSNPLVGANISVVQW